MQKKDMRGKGLAAHQMPARVITAVQVAAHDLELRQQRLQALAGGAALVVHTPNPLMLGLSPSAYVLRAVGGAWVCKSLSPCLCLCPCQKA